MGYNALYNSEGMQKRSFIQSRVNCTSAVSLQSESVRAVSDSDLQAANFWKAGHCSAPFILEITESR